jgi:hypothetical protein
MRMAARGAPIDDQVVEIGLSGALRQRRISILTSPQEMKPHKHERAQALQIVRFLRVLAQKARKKPSIKHASPRENWEF